MSACLLDVNLLIALTWPTHIHHALARDWFDHNAGDGWATCPITELGFLRVSSNPRAIADAVAPQAALALLGRLKALPGHCFWPDDISVAASGPFSSLTLVGHRQLTDAYLLALAQRQEGKLATLDKGIPELIRERGERARWVELIRDES